MFLVFKGRLLYLKYLLPLSNNHISYHHLLTRASHWNKHFITCDHNEKYWVKTFVSQQRKLKVGEVNYFSQGHKTKWQSWSMNSKAGALFTKLMLTYPSV
jgi:hypothetical protein